MSHSIEIPQDILDSAKMTPAEMRLELALLLYARGRLSVGKARQLADLPLWEFRQALASRRIAAHYDRDDLAEDVATLEHLKRL